MPFLGVNYMLHFESSLEYRFAHRPVVRKARCGCISSLQIIPPHGSVSFNNRCTSQFCYMHLYVRCGVRLILALQTSKKCFLAPQAPSLTEEKTGHYSFACIYPFIHPRGPRLDQLIDSTNKASFSPRFMALVKAQLGGAVRK